ncbi:aliphatic sulfonate ABC transporter substrate-binding protein [Nesterenkonia sp. HG001]|uniref:aliphatic sulfonate ABC transporter substrate-binding protein n=1 Tax=Nesterenkonia sp. HG001 TaxID=2983207 RepID=UPI002AC4D73F|nr:aliphatic sulfonate ABC transporter substrate-binding protein [Nesterenkonia sp. HG001]MDZ5077463.1 aliphatic sulfonate ABC transporter substrate-binding protein [Nesterenkonia sp. HG001]
MPSLTSTSPSPARATIGRTSRAAVAGLAVTLMAAGCVEGEGSGDAADGELATLSIDFATYNPLSLVMMEHGWLEEELADAGTEVEWIQSHGSNDANEKLRAQAIDIGSTAGSAALLARANGTEIHTILVENQPEWAALVTSPDSGISSVEDLDGASVAATLGTDPYFFLVQSLQEAGLEISDVDVQNLQHADGRSALGNGDVDAWAGLDPIMAGAEADGEELFYRNVDFNTYSVINATEPFIEDHPEVAQTVVDVYEQARQWALENPEETAEILAEYGNIDQEVAETVIQERSSFDVDPVPGQAQHDVLEEVGPIFLDTGDVSTQESIDEALESLFHPEFAENREATEAEGAEGEATIIEDDE